MTDTANDPSLEAARTILTAEAVRDRTAALFALIEDGKSEHFTYDAAALPRLADRVAALTRERFPTLQVPLHARWRHFEVGGMDRLGGIAAAREWSSPEEAARAMGDLAITSVLLDAGAGPRWEYHEAATGQRIGRSEGLGLASLGMFVAGAFSAVPADPLRADAEALESLTVEEFAAGFQITPDNPLDGADGRRALLVSLAEALRASPDLFASEDDPRPGGIIDALAAEAGDAPLPAAAILDFVLEGLSPIWPSRLTLAGIPLGDTWAHPALGDGTPGSDLVPFHKLSTWLSLSLIEPLLVHGVTVTDLDALPGLAEYRNGGLFVDGGALLLRDPKAAETPHAVDEPLIVEWRAATVTLLNRIAPLVRERLGVSAEDLPLAAILEGGTWLAGRQLAAEKRADKSPPIPIISDGTVF
ncbi:URC4/urg3 family protein [Acuticoccus sp. MNP-M23]|uniref:URC4/urg3 family protein n=1 Tax=Acuticoccus sp. MNP-M23 TaxID=3072793 RepID=UPI002814F16C|nr:URC4/urg3 family protein [Acuticoccus sp. MNP-M23]WMS43053.1 URC4/urg3 family protein [Acuticoccus sp. MNP-M23]